MDYSLLVGVHNLDIAAKERTVSRQTLLGAQAYLVYHFYISSHSHSTYIILQLKY